MDHFGENKEGQDARSRGIKKGEKRKRGEREKRARVNGGEGFGGI